MLENLYPQLKKLGLNHSEVVVYLFLLEHGLSTPPIVSRETNIARTNCYNVLNDLMEKSLIEEVVDGKRKAYRAHNPTALLQSVERQRDVATRVLPDLQGIFTTNKHKPKVEFFDGLEEVKRLYLQSLNAPEIITTEMKNLLQADLDFCDMYVDEVKKRGIRFVLPLKQADPATVTVAAGVIVSRETITDVSGHRDVEPATILIFDNTVAYITFTEPIYATTMTSEAMTRSMRLILGKTPI